MRKDEILHFRGVFFLTVLGAPFVVFVVWTVASVISFFFSFLLPGSWLIFDTSNFEFTGENVGTYVLSHSFIFFAGFLGAIFSWGLILWSFEGDRWIPLKNRNFKSTGQIRELETERTQKLNELYENRMNKRTFPKGYREANKLYEKDRKKIWDSFADKITEVATNDRSYQRVISREKLPISLWFKNSFGWLLVIPSTLCVAFISFFLLKTVRINQGNFDTPSSEVKEEIPTLDSLADEELLLAQKTLEELLLAQKKELGEPLPIFEPPTLEAYELSFTDFITGFIYYAGGVVLFLLLLYFSWMSGRRTMQIIEEKFSFKVEFFLRPLNVVTHIAVFVTIMIFGQTLIWEKLLASREVRFPDSEMHATVDISWNEIIDSRFTEGWFLLGWLGLLVLIAALLRIIYKHKRNG